MSVHPTPRAKLKSMLKRVRPSSRSRGSVEWRRGRRMRDELASRGFAGRFDERPAMAACPGSGCTTTVGERGGLTLATHKGADMRVGPQHRRLATLCAQV